MATNQTPTRRLPVRAAKVRANSNPVQYPTTPRPGGRVTRSSAVFTSTPSPSAAGSAGKRAASPNLASPNKRPRRQPTRAGHYAESSGDDEDESHDEQSEADSSHASKTDSDDEPLFSVRKKRSSPRKMMPTPVKTKKARTRAAARRRTKKSGGRTVTKHVSNRSPTKASTKSKHVAVSALPQRKAEPPVIPPWKHLPYYTLLRIFQFAAGAPLTIPAAKWLLDISVMCRAFTEPALTALYTFPPLLTPHMAHGLASLLSKSPDQTTFNYRQKVKCLEIEAGSVAAKSFRGQHLDFQALLNNAPRLVEVYIWHEKDLAPYRALYENIKWTYPADMYLALGVNHSLGDAPVAPVEDISRVPRLRSWMWNRRMLGRLPMHNLKAIHGYTAFQGLRKLVLTNFQLAWPPATSSTPDIFVEADAKLINDLAQCISVLRELKHLVVECSTLVNGRFLAQLPKTIEVLELICCWDVTADHFADYLLSHGNALRHLALHHNQALSLAWLPVLRDACPKLESLRMNMAYFSTLATYDTSDPAYETLLTADQVPTWPAALRHLALKNMRRWDKSAAEVFFRSLLDGAPNLLALRHIEIKAMLDISVRERAELREDWEGNLKRVFLRKWVDPLPHFTLRPPPQIAEDEVVPAHTSDEPSKMKMPDDAPDGPSPRRSGRIATLPSGPSSRASSTGRDMRGGRPTYAEPDTDEDMANESAAESDHSSSRASSPAAEGENKSALFVQGLCTTVDILFDNQKPVENPFRMDDFLDDSSDDPTDDDWSEDAAAGYESDHRHAW